MDLLFALIKSDTAQIIAFMGLVRILFTLWRAVQDVRTLAEDLKAEEHARSKEDGKLWEVIETQRRRIDNLILSKGGGNG